MKKNQATKTALLSSFRLLLFLVVIFKSGYPSIMLQEETSVSNKESSNFQYLLSILPKSVYPSFQLKVSSWVFKQRELFLLLSASLINSSSQAVQIFLREFDQFDSDLEPIIYNKSKINRSDYRRLKDAVQRFSFNLSAQLSFIEYDPLVTPIIYLSIQSLVNEFPQEHEVQSTLYDWIMEHKKACITVACLIGAVAVYNIGYLRGKTELERKKQKQQEAIPLDPHVKNALICLEDVKLEEQQVQDFFEETTSFFVSFNDFISWNVLNCNYNRTMSCFIKKYHIHFLCDDKKTEFLQKLNESDDTPTSDDTSLTWCVENALENKAKVNLSFIRNFDFEQVYIDFLTKKVMPIRKVQIYYDYLHEQVRKLGMFVPADSKTFTDDWLNYSVDIDDVKMGKKKVFPFREIQAFKFPSFEDTYKAFKDYEALLWQWEELVDPTKIKEKTTEIKAKVEAIKVKLGEANKNLQNILQIHRDKLSEFQQLIVLCKPKIKELHEKLKVWDQVLKDFQKTKDDSKFRCCIQFESSLGQTEPSKANKRALKESDLIYISGCNNGEFFCDACRKQLKDAQCPLCKAPQLHFSHTFNAYCFKRFEQIWGGLLGIKPADPSKEDVLQKALSGKI